MLPRRFALIRHVDYTGAAGTGVIAYGVAFDDGQVVLRWSSAHRATSVLDSVEDLIAAHGHGETTSIEWIDAPHGKSDASSQPAGRRARRPSPTDDAPPATDVPQLPTPPETAPAEVADPRPAAPEQREPAPIAESADVRPAAQARQASTSAETGAAQSPAQSPRTPPFDEPAAARPAAHAPRAPTPSPTDGGKTTAPVPAPPAAFARPTAPLAEPSTQPNGAANPNPQVPASQRQDATSQADRNGDQRSHDHGADVIGHPAAGQGADEERRARHEAIATQPMNTDLSEDRGQRGPRRAAAPMRESPRSIFEESEEPLRPDLRLASSNGPSRESGDSNDSGDTSPGHEEFGGYFSPGHQHLDTVTGLLDLPAGLNKRGRGSGAEQDAIASRRNGGRHRGE